MVRRILFQLCSLTLCVVMLLLPAAALAAITLEADIGYDGVITYVRTLPIRVRITNTGADASGVVTVDVNRNEQEYDRYELPLSIASGSTLEVSLPVVLTQMQKKYTVSWVVDGQTVAQQEIEAGGTIDPSTMIVGALGGNAADFSSFSISKAGDPLLREEYWTVLPLEAASFPSDLESMRFFDMLAVDGFDMSTLTQQQQDTLDSWLKGGGVIVVGGGANAAEDFGFFKKYTGISAGTVENAGDITEGMLEVFGVGGAPLGQDVMTVSLEGGGGQKVGSPALADVTRVEKGYVVTCSFAISEKPLNTWLEKNALWQRLLLASVQARYQDMVESRRYGGYIRDSHASVDMSVTNNIGVENTGLAVLPMVVVGVFVLLAGFGAYWLFKRLDRREWMWVAVPALAVAASLALWGMSQALPLRDPAATYYTVLTVDENGHQSGYSAVMATRAGREPMTVGTANGTLELLDSISYYTNSNPLTLENASKLRYVCTYGPVTTITYPQSGVWNYGTLIVRDAPTEDMSGVGGGCRWVGDSLVFSVTNNSRIPLENGVILTDYGFVTVGALLPGQTAEAVLTPLPASAPGAPRNREDSFGDGIFISEEDLLKYSYSIYDFVERATFANPKDMTKEEYNEAMIRRSLLSNISRDNGESRFRFVAFCNELTDLALEIDGQPVTRTAQRGMVTVDLAYDPVAEDGSVRFLRGSFPVYSAAEDENGKPLLQEKLDPNQYQSFPLVASRNFAFDLSTLPQGMHLTAMDISTRYAYYSYKVSLYNPTTGEWDECKRYTLDDTTGLGESEITLPDLQDYLMNGFLYCRFEKLGAADSYADIDTPAITMEGRVE
ncbi:MAG: hypothetical protein MR742_13145 [Clostridiales bacterium]|nr:hypothetical protein [Clostridiales bacterium]